MNLILKTENLLLRPWELKDKDDLVQGLNNLNVSKWLAVVPYPYTERFAEEFIAYCIENKTDGYSFAIELLSENKVIGGTNINKINPVQGTASGGIWLNEAYHGHGYGTEAFRKRAEFAFNVLNLRRLESGCFAGNEASLGMQQKIGYVVEGLRRKGFLCRADGQYKDEITMALLREDWIIEKSI